MEQLIYILKEQNKELLNQKEQITAQIRKTEKLMEDYKTKVNSEEKEISEKEGDKAT